MKIVFRSMADEVRAAIDTTADLNRTIERIELTPLEWNEFINDLDDLRVDDLRVDGLHDACLNGLVVYGGVKIVKVVKAAR